MDIQKIDLRRGDFEAMHPKAKLFGFDEDKKLYTGDGVESINCQWTTWCACIGMLCLDGKEAQAVPEWIETAIQPPEEGQKVIISGIYGVGMAEFSYLYEDEFSYLYKDEFVMYDMGASNPILSKDQVKFWQPLPDAPQEPAND